VQVTEASMRVLGQETQTRWEYDQSGVVVHQVRIDTIFSSSQCLRHQHRVEMFSIVQMGLGFVRRSSWSVSLQ
jgi:hypothetical protein